jgi:hypothetical protein
LSIVKQAAMTSLGRQRYRQRLEIAGRAMGSCSERWCIATDPPRAPFEDESIGPCASGCRLRAMKASKSNGFEAQRSSSFDQRGTECAKRLLAFR